MLLIKNSYCHTPVSSALCEQSRDITCSSELLIIHLLLKVFFQINHISREETVTDLLIYSELQKTNRFKHIVNYTISVIYSNVFSCINQGPNYTSKAKDNEFIFTLTSS